MMWTRRGFLGSAAALAAIAALPATATAQAQARLVIIGGGFGGASAARSLRRLLPEAQITLVEPSVIYTACPFSNLVIAGERGLDMQEFAYGALVADGIEVIADRAIDVDAGARLVRLGGGATLSYDRLIMSPGIDFRWNAIEGYDEAASMNLPHAWKAGAQTSLLARQLAAMPAGGTVLMSVPQAPYRCPPGPYERASLIAHYLKTRKPGSKLVILDAKESFSKMGLFEEAWDEHYSEIVEWRPASMDGRVTRVDARARLVYTDFEALGGDVINVIPPQQAGLIAQRAGVADATGWCPIDATSFESTLQPNIHVIGDAAIAAPMPKSAFAANLQAKICAIAVARLVNDLAPEPTVLANMCYSFTTPETAVSIAGVYRNSDATFSAIEGSGGLSALGESEPMREAEAAHARDWFNAITAEAFG